MFWLCLLAGAQVHLADPSPPTLPIRRKCRAGHFRPLVLLAYGVPEVATLGATQTFKGPLLGVELWAPGALVAWMFGRVWQPLGNLWVGLFGKLDPHLRDLTDVASSVNR